jgi:hypothetical protein
MMALCSSETSNYFYEIRRHQIPEGGRLHIRRCENLKSHMSQIEYIYISCIMPIFFLGFQKYDVRYELEERNTE